MTLTGIRTTMKEVEAIREMLPKTPSPMDVAVDEFMGKFSAQEICRMGSILTRVDNGVPPTNEENEFMSAMESRPTMSLPPIMAGQPVCQYCHKQPASERELAFGVCCDDCFVTMGGNFDINTLPRDGNGNYIA